MKTGEKTNPHVLHVLKQMDPGKACGSKPEMAVSGQKPAKRLRAKTPEKEAMQVPEMAEQASSSKPKIFIAVSPDEENAASDGNTSNDGNAASDGSAAIAASSDVEFFEISDTSEEEITAEQLKKPEMAQKKPAKSSKQATAKASMKKPSVVMAQHHSWVASCSFGLVKETKASSKAYIQARNGPTEKPYCSAATAGFGYAQWACFRHPLEQQFSCSLPRLCMATLCCIQFLHGSSKCFILPWMGTPSPNRPRGDIEPGLFTQLSQALFNSFAKNFVSLQAFYAMPTFLAHSLWGAKSFCTTFSSSSQDFFMAAKPLSSCSAISGCSSSAL